MPSSEHTLALPASPERVWNLVTAVRCWPRWLCGISGVRAIRAAAAGAGTTFEVERAGQHHREQWIVADWEPRRRVRFTEYHADIQLILLITPTSGASGLSVGVEWPKARGPLGRLLAANAQGGRWARGVPAALAHLHNIFASNRDIPLLHGDE